MRAPGNRDLCLMGKSAPRCSYSHIYMGICISNTGTSKKKKKNMVKKFCNLFQKVKLFYILDSLHVK